MFSLFTTYPSKLVSNNGSAHITITLNKNNPRTPFITHCIIQVSPSIHHLLLNTASFWFPDTPIPLDFIEPLYYKYTSIPSNDGSEVIVFD